MNLDWTYRSTSLVRRSVALLITTAFLFTTLAEPWAQTSFWDQQRNSRRNLYKQTDPQTAEVRALLSGVSWPKETVNPLFGAFKLSSQLGTIVETHLAAASDVEPEKIQPLTVYHIQDAHGVYGAQYNASQIINGLTLAFGPDKTPLLVCQEGGMRPVKTDWLSAFPFDPIRQEVAHAHLRMGNLTGEEYLALVESSGVVKLRGVENKNLYLENVDTRRTTTDARRMAARYLGHLQARLDAVKDRVYSPSLLELDRNVRDYAEKKITFVEHLQGVMLHSPTPVSRNEFPNIHSTLVLADMESRMDLAALQEERVRLVDAMSEQLSIDSLKELVAKATEMRLGHVNPRVFYQGLVSVADLLEQKGVSVPTGNLRQYVSYLELMEKIDHEKLLLEADRLKARVFDRYAASDRVRQLIGLDRRVRRETDAWNLAMNPTHYAEYLEEGPQNFVEAERYLSSQEQSLGISPDPISTPADLQAWLGQREVIHRYYELALERDLVLVRNALDAMKETGATRAVLVAGGFHTPGMTQALREMGVNYVVIQPRFKPYRAVTQDQPLQISSKYDFNEQNGSVREPNKLDITGPLSKDLSKQIALQFSIDAIVSEVLSKFRDEREKNAQALSEWWKSINHIVPIDIRRSIELEKGQSRQVILFGRADGEPVALVYDFRNKIMVLIGENSDLSGVSGTELDEKLGPLLKERGLYEMWTEFVSKLKTIQQLKASPDKSSTKKVEDLRREVNATFDRLAARSVDFMINPETLPATSAGKKGREIFNQAKENFPKAIQGAVGRILQKESADGSLATLPPVTVMGRWAALLTWLARFPRWLASRPVFKSRFAKRTVAVVALLLLASPVSAAVAAVPALAASSGFLALLNPMTVGPVLLVGLMLWAFRKNIREMIARWHASPRIVAPVQPAEQPVISEETSPEQKKADQTADQVAAAIQQWLDGLTPADFQVEGQIDEESAKAVLDGVKQSRQRDEIHTFDDLMASVSASLTQLGGEQAVISTKIAVLKKTLGDKMTPFVISVIKQNVAQSGAERAPPLKLSKKVWITLLVATALGAFAYFYGVDAIYHGLLDLVPSVPPQLSLAGLQASIFKFSAFLFYFFGNVVVPLTGLAVLGRLFASGAMGNTWIGQKFIQWSKPLTSFLFDNRVSKGLSQLVARASAKSRVLAVLLHLPKELGQTLYGFAFEKGDRLFQIFLALQTQKEPSLRGELSPNERFFIRVDKVLAKLHMPSIVRGSALIFLLPVLATTGILGKRLVLKFYSTIGQTIIVGLLAALLGGVALALGSDTSVSLTWLSAILNFNLLDPTNIGWAHTLIAQGGVLGAVIQLFSPFGIASSYMLALIMTLVSGSRRLRKEAKAAGKPRPGFLRAMWMSLRQKVHIIEGKDGKPRKVSIWRAGLETAFSPTKYGLSSLHMVGLEIEVFKWLASFMGPLNDVVLKIEDSSRVSVISAGDQALGMITQPLGFDVGDAVSVIPGTRGLGMQEIQQIQGLKWQEQRETKDVVSLSAAFEAIQKGDYNADAVQSWEKVLENVRLQQENQLSMFKGMAEDGSINEETVEMLRKSVDERVLKYDNALQALKQGKMTADHIAVLEEILSQQVTQRDNTRKELIDLLNRAAGDNLTFGQKFSRSLKSFFDLFRSKEKVAPKAKTLEPETPLLSEDQLNILGPENQNNVVDEYEQETYQFSPPPRRYTPVTPADFMPHNIIGTVKTLVTDVGVTAMNSVDNMVDNADAAAELELGLIERQDVMVMEVIRPSGWMITGMCRSIRVSILWRMSEPRSSPCWKGAPCILFSPMGRAIASPFIRPTGRSSSISTCHPIFRWPRPIWLWSKKGSSSGRKSSSAMWWVTPEIPVTPTMPASPLISILSIGAKGSPSTLSQIFFSLIR